jgi:ligand-binding sensor domain-containing protein
MILIRVSFSMKVLLIITVLFLSELVFNSSVLAQNPGDKVLSIFVDEFGCQWFGTGNGLLRKCNNSWKAYPVQPDSPGIVNDIKSLTTSKGNEIWIGTMNGIIRITYNANSIITATGFYSRTNSFLTDIIRGITFDKTAAAFFATPGGIGLLANSKWKYISEVPDVADNNFTTAYAKGDTIYFGTKGEGVARLVRSADVYSGASSFLAPWSGLPGDNITTIFIDSKGIQWFGSESGISRHYKPDAKEGWDETYTKILPDTNVNVIAEDKAGNILVGTNKGMARFRDGKPEVTIWTLKDGLPSDIINDIFVSKDGSIWIGTDKGAALFNGVSFVNFKTSNYTKGFPKFKKIVKLN